MTIRPPKPEDTNALVELGVEFAEKSKPIHRMSVEPEKIRELIFRAINDPQVVGLVAENGTEVVGFIVGVIAPSYFSNDLAFQELAFYMRKGTGGVRLLTALEVEVAKRGVTKIYVGSKPKFCDLGKVYKHRGYQLVEEHYLKTTGV